MALTAQQRLDALSDAYYAGVRTVQNGDEVVTYRTLAEMLVIMRQLEQQVAGTPLTPPTISVGYNEWNS